MQVVPWEMVQWLTLLSCRHEVMLLSKIPANKVISSHTTVKCYEPTPSTNVTLLTSTANPFSLGLVNAI